MRHADTTLQIGLLKKYLTNSLSRRYDNSIGREGGRETDRHTHTHRQTDREML